MVDRVHRVYGSRTNIINLTFKGKPAMTSNNSRNLHVPEPPDQGSTTRFEDSGGLDSGPSTTHPTHAHLNPFNLTFREVNRTNLFNVHTWPKWAQRLYIHDNMPANQLCYAPSVDYEDWWTLNPEGFTVRCGWADHRDTRRLYVRKQPEDKTFNSAPEQQNQSEWPDWATQRYLHEDQVCFRDPENKWWFYFSTGTLKRCAGWHINPERKTDRDTAVHDAEVAAAFLRGYAKGQEDTEARQQARKADEKPRQYTDEPCDHPEAHDPHTYGIFLWCPGRKAARGTMIGRQHES